MKQYRALLPRNILQVRGKSANSNNSPSFNNNCNDKNCDKEKSRQNQELPFSLESSPSFTLNTTKTRTTATDKMSTNESHSLPSVEVKRTSSAGISSLLNQPLITSPTSSENFQYYEIEDNPKRSKNAEASARFRQRRKVREKKMQEQSKILQQKVYNMQTEAERLSMEVNRMKANFETSKNTTKLLQSTLNANRPQQILERNATFTNEKINFYLSSSNPGLFEDVSSRSEEFRQYNPMGGH